MLKNVEGILMNRKDKLTKRLLILEIIFSSVGLGSGVVGMILQNKLGWENGWVQFTLCLAIICCYELAYSSGYLKCIYDYPMLSSDEKTEENKTNEKEK